MSVQPGRDATPAVTPAQPASGQAVAMDDRFQHAVALSQSLYSPAQWQLLEPTQRSAVIYAQLRRLDTLGRDRPKPDAVATPHPMSARIRAA